MTTSELNIMAGGISIGLRKAKELFKKSTDAKGNCKLLSTGESCNCFLCLCDKELVEVSKVLIKNGN